LGRLRGKNPFPQSISPGCWAAICALVFGKHDVLLVACGHAQPSFVVCLWYVVCARNLSQHHLPLSLNNLDKGEKMKYRVHRLNLKLSEDQGKLEQFLNNLDGEVISIIPNVTFIPILLASKVDFVLIVEKLS
jgi:hypothetical protein